MLVPTAKMTPFQTSFPHALEVRNEIAVGDVVLRLKGTHCRRSRVLSRKVAQSS